MAEEQRILVDAEGNVTESEDDAVGGEIIDENGWSHLFTLNGEQSED